MFNGCWLDGILRLVHLTLDEVCVMFISPLKLPHFYVLLENANDISNQRSQAGDPWISSGLQTCFFGLHSVLKQCLNELPTSRNSETSWGRKKTKQNKKTSRFPTSLENLEGVAGLCVPASSKLELSSSCPLGGALLSHLPQSLSFLILLHLPASFMSVAARPLPHLHLQFLPQIPLRLTS